MGGRIGYSSSGQVSSLCASIPGSPYSTETRSARIRSQDLFRSFSLRQESTKEARRRGERKNKENYSSDTSETVAVAWFLESMWRKCVRKSTRTPQVTLRRKNLWHGAISRAILKGVEVADQADQSSSSPLAHEPVGVAI